MSHRLFQLEMGSISILFKITVVLGCISVAVIVGSTVVLYIRNKDKDECFKHLKRDLLSLYDDTIGIFIRGYIEAIKHILCVR